MGAKKIGSQTKKIIDWWQTETRTNKVACRQTTIRTHRKTSICTAVSCSCTHGARVLSQLCLCADVKRVDHDTPHGTDLFFTHLVTQHRHVELLQVVSRSPGCCRYMVTLLLYCLSGPHSALLFLPTPFYFSFYCFLLCFFLSLLKVISYLLNTFFFSPSYLWPPIRWPCTLNRPSLHVTHHRCPGGE